MVKWSDETIIEKLLTSDEPSIRWKVRSRVHGDSEDALIDLRQEIKASPRVRALLGDRDEKGRVRPVHHVYKKWNGAHWVLAHLADIGYPEGDSDLIPIREQVLNCWLERIQEYVCEKPIPSRDGVPVINGRARRCASQQSNALYATLALGLADDRCQQLAELLMRWQWPDGGWNCDCKPEAKNSSFWESLIPLRALSLYARATGDQKARASTEHAAELFLKRRLFRRLSDGEVMNEQFTRLHYPCYWRYDVLFALKVMAEGGFISDPRCADALDLLESKRLPDGGWPAEERFYRKSDDGVSGSDRVAWGMVSAKKMNEWVTADALYVMKAAGRLKG